MIIKTRNKQIFIPFFLTANLQYNTVSITVIPKIKSLQMEELNLLIRLIGETILRA